jgi:hypothetical protein
VDELHAMVERLKSDWHTPRRGCVQPTAGCTRPPGPVRAARATRARTAS